MLVHRPSEIGSENPKCLWNGQWEVGISCVPIMCESFNPPQYATANTDAPVMAGSRVHIICDEYYEFARDSVGSRSPMCLDNSQYEQSAMCVPMPCPKEPSPVPCKRHGRAGVSATGIVAHPSEKQIKDWEDETDYPSTFDYIPNVFGKKNVTHMFMQLAYSHLWLFACNYMLVQYPYSCKLCFLFNT